MPHEISPAVERALAGARACAARHGSNTVRLVDLLLALIEDDEGKPAILLEKLGSTPESVRSALANGSAHPVPAPSDTHLLKAARVRAVTLRGDPTLTTEFLLLAVLEADRGFHRAMTELGIAAEELARLLRSDEMAWEAEEVTPEPPGELVSESGEAARVVDANLNRSREALRVLEDYCRFTLNDRVLSEQTKSLRHRLAEATVMLPARQLLAARDTPGDVGTAVTTAGEYDRRSLADVAVANGKRLQESLRSAEEFGKLLSPQFGQAIERIRYESYTLERAIAIGANARTRLADARLYVLLSESRCPAGLERTIFESAAGGANVIQLRDKSLPDRALLELARRARRWCREACVLCIINDRPDIARLVEADGVHLGQDDLPVAAARRIVGPDAMIGVSTHNIAQLRQAVLDGADYLGIGPTFPSRTKEFAEFPGLDFVRQATAETTLPAFILGGIDVATLPQAVVAGAKRVAVSAAVAEASDPRLAAARLIAFLPPRPETVGTARTAQNEEDGRA